MSVAEWYPATHLQRLRMAKYVQTPLFALSSANFLTPSVYRTWMNTPHMSELMNLDLAFEVYNSSDTSLLALPNTVLQRILEYSEMVRVETASFLYPRSMPRIPYGAGSTH